VFNLVRYGNEGTIKVDALEDVNITCDIGKPILLPKTVNAIMTDSSKSQVPVTWDVTEAELQTMSNNGAGKYTVTGTADGMTAKAYITVLEFNYLQNYSFETGDLTGWTLTELGKADQLYVEDKVTDSLTGTFHMHFWSAAQNSVEFILEQKVEGLTEGSYRFSMSIMGGDCGDTNIYIFVKINGETVDAAPLQITTYGNWDTAWLEDIIVAEGDVVVVGIYVKAQGAGNGAWGKIDDALFHSDLN
jgi:arabinogalactan endo-1,4-beta-galactosidase